MTDYRVYYLECGWELRLTSIQPPVDGTSARRSSHLLVRLPSTLITYSFSIIRPPIWYNSLALAIHTSFDLLLSQPTASNCLSLTHPTNAHHCQWFSAFGALNEETCLLGTASLSHSFSLLRDGLHDGRRHTFFTAQNKVCVKYLTQHPQ